MSTANPSPKEAVHDRDISPLIDQIIAIARANNISMVACFSLGDEPAGEPNEGEHIFCTTCIVHPGEQKHPAQRLTAAAKLLRDGFFAFMSTRKQ